MQKESSGRKPSWQERTAQVLRLLILASGIFQIFWGTTSIGILILLSLAMITFPSFFTRKRITSIPLEIELILFIMVFVQFVLGEARNFYDIPYYDKFVHYLLPMFIGLIGFLIFYSAFLMGKIQASPTVMVILVILITLGVGAAWEIFEYGSDQILAPRIEGWHHFQGNAQQDPLHDTMSDLIIDTLGGIFGALLALRYTRKSLQKKSKRFPEMMEEIGKQLK